MHPTVESLSRVACADYALPDTTHVILKGTVVVLPVRAIHNDPEYYPNPEEFNPDRFTELEIAKRPAYTYFSAGEGTRAIIELPFAMLQIKLGLVLMLRQYKLRVNGKTKEPVKINPISTFAEPKNKIWIDFKQQ